MRPVFVLFFLCLAPASAQNRGIITTVAGTGVAGYNGDNIPAVRAQLDFAIGDYFGDEYIYDYCHPAVDAAGNLYLPDKFNDRIRKVDTQGIITTVAGNGQEGYNGNGGPATEAAIDSPVSIAFDAAGNMF